VTLLLVPGLAVAGQLFFAVAHPIDAFGPIKGAYLQFACGPLAGVFGVHASGLSSTRLGKPLLAAAVLAVAAIAAYSVHARLRGFV
jgi:hypothetical protein